jgi:hypothetical protein
VKGGRIWRGHCREEDGMLRANEAEIVLAFESLRAVWHPSGFYRIQMSTLGPMVWSEESRLENGNRKSIFYSRPA